MATNSEGHETQPDLHSRTVADLKELLRIYGLNTTGNKAELIFCILEADPLGQGVMRRGAGILEKGSTLPQESDKLQKTREENNALLVELAEARRLIRELQDSMRKKNQEDERRNSLMEAHAQHEAINREIIEARKQIAAMTETSVLDRETHIRGATQNGEKIIQLDGGSRDETTSGGGHHHNQGNFRLPLGEDEEFAQNRLLSQRGLGGVQKVNISAIGELLCTFNGTTGDSESWEKQVQLYLKKLINWKIRW